MKAKLIALFFIVSAIAPAFSQQKEKCNAKYVFFFIGDGMGIQQVNTSKVYADSVLNDPAGVVFTKFPVTSFASTFAATRYITCSAAAGTALSTGSKTSIGTIGLSTNRKDTLWSIAKKFKENGKKVAVLTSVSIDHATPSAFYAHKGSRSSYYEIAKDLLSSDYDFFASGGFVQPNGSKDDSSTTSVYELGAGQGVGFTSTFAGVDSLKKQRHRTIVYSVPNPAPSSTLQYEIDRQDFDITLADITQKAIDVVDNPHGFFMMVEGGKIDWACHDNDAATAIHEVLAFSKAVNVAFEFYRKHPTETLIIVTADHETGGMSLGNTHNGYKNFLKILKNQKSSQEQFHSVISKFKKDFPNSTFNDILAIIKAETGLSADGEFALTQDELMQIQHAFEVYFGISKPSDGKNMYSETDILAKTVLAILNSKAGIGWTSDTHTGSPVPVFAIGCGQDLFTNFMDNTDIPKRILIASGQGEK